MQEQIIGLITPAMALIFTVIFLGLWLRGSLGKHALAFSAAYFAFGLGFLVTHLLSGAGDGFATLLSHLFYSISSVCLIWGAAKRVGQPIPLLVMGIIYGLAASILWLAVNISDQTDPRFYIANTGYGTMFVLGAVALFRTPNRTVIDTLIAYLFTFVAAQFLIRPVLTILLAGGVNASEYRHSIFYSVLSLVITIQTMVTALILIGACIWDQIVSQREWAERDVLTGLRARRAFEHDGLALIERAKQEGVPVSLVVADIDHFKAVNDVYGHQVGDRAIAVFGGVIDNMIRNSDIAGRIGGEEFCVIAWNCDDERAKAMAERIRRRIADTPIPGMASNNRLTASFGVAARQGTEGYGRLFARADAELYRAKANGRNQVCGESLPDTVTEFQPRARSSQAAG